MNVLLFDGHSYQDAEATARRLEREELVTRCGYEVGPNHVYPPCQYCDGHQGDAELSWSWDRHDATTDGCAECCCRWECCRAVLSEAEQDADPENITVEHPLIVLPNIPAQAA